MDTLFNLAECSSCEHVDHYATPQPELPRHASTTSIPVPSHNLDSLQVCSRWQVLYQALLLILVTLLEMPQPHHHNKTESKLIHALLQPPWIPHYTKLSERQFNHNGLSAIKSDGSLHIPANASAISCYTTSPIVCATRCTPLKPCHTGIPEQALLITANTS